MSDQPWQDYVPTGAPAQAASAPASGPWSDYGRPQLTGAPWQDYGGAEQPGLLSNIASAAKAGMVQDVRNLAGLPGTLAGKPQVPKATTPQPWEESFELADLAHPSRALPKIAYYLGQSGSTLGAGLAGAAAGEAVEPAAGGLVGGAIAAGTMTALNQLTPLFAEEMQKPNADPDQAFDAALRRAGQAGIFSGAGWAAFGARMLEGPVKNLLFQAFGVQPAISAGQQVTENIEQGRPAAQGVGSAALSGMVGTAVPLIGMEGAHVLAGHSAAAPAPPAETPAPEAPAPATPLQTLERIGGMSETSATGTPAEGGAPRTVADIVAAEGVTPTEAKLIQEREVDALRARQAAPATLDPNAPAPADVARPTPFSDGQGGMLPGGAITRDPAVWQRWLAEEEAPTRMPVPGTTPPGSSATERPAGTPEEHIQPPGAAVAAARQAPLSGAYAMVPPTALRLDPQRFQYKASDERGVTGVLAGTNRWEPALANPITAWQDEDGALFVVNGHQRTDLALRAEAAGQPDVQVPTRVFRAADGYTPEYMRALGAYQNIAEGSGTAIDAAKVLRATATALPDSVRLPDLPPQQAIVRDGRALAQLSDQAFGVVENGIVPPEYAARVGEAISDPTEQMAALDVLARAQPANANQARLMVQDIRNSGFLHGEQTSLFGDEAFAQSLVPERARVLDAAQRVLRQNRNVFRATVRGEETLTGAGNVLDAEANRRGQTDNERLLETLQRDATTRGPLSDALTAAARDLAAGKKLNGVAAQFLTEARRLERTGRAAGVPAGAPAGGAGFAGEGEPPVEGQEPLFQRLSKPRQSGAPLFGEPERAAERREMPARLTDRAGLEREGQTVLPGMEASARQAQAAREAAGPRSDQQPANEGLFVPRETERPGLLQRGWHSVEMGVPVPLPHPDAVRAAIAAVRSMTGNRVRVDIGDIHVPGQPTVQAMTLGRVIRAALQPRTEWNLHHETVHALRNLGVLSPREWNTLTAAAAREGWHGEFEIGRRYGDHSAEQQAEEAVAEKFAQWATGAKSVAASGPLHAIWRRVSAFFDRLRNALAGRGFRTAEDVFGAMQRGEVGAREPDSGAPERGPVTPAESDEALRRWRRQTGVQFSGLEPSFQRVTDRRQQERLPPTAPPSAVRRAADEIQSVLSPTSRSPVAKRMEYSMREFTGRLAQASQRSAAVLEDARREAATLPDAARLDMFDRAERGEKQATPALDAAMTALRGEQAVMLKKVQSLGYLRDTIDNYMGHMYSNYREWASGQVGNLTPQQVEARNQMLAAMKRPVRGAGEFLKPRTFDSLREAMAAGLQPVTTNPIDMQLLKLRSMQRFYEGTTFAETLKRSGMLHWVPVDATREAEAQGMKKLDDTVFQPRLRADEQYGVREVGNWMAPGPAADVFNNYMSRGLTARFPTIYGGIRATAQALNGLQLGFSGFHATFTALDSMHSQTALGLQQIAGGRPLAGLRSIATAPAAPITTFRLGNALRAAYIDPAHATPEMQVIVNALVKGGGRIGYDQFYRSTEAGPFFRSLKDLARPQGAFREAWNMVKPQPGDPLGTRAAHVVGGSLRIAGRLIDTTMEPLMGHVVPRMKLGVFASMAKDWIGQHPEASEDEFAAAMTKAWDSVDNRMGELVYDNLFWNKALKDLAFITTRSVGWNLGTLRELGGAAVDVGAQASNVAGGRAPELTNRMAYAVAMTVNTAVLGAVMTYLATGRGPQSLMDYFYPPDGTVQPNGALNRLSIPGYMKDVIDWTRAPFQTAANKMNPLLETGIELAQNRDYYGGIIYNADRDSPFAAYAEYLLNQTLPFSMRATNRLAAQNASPLQQMLGFWGIQPAPQSIVNPANGEAYNRRETTLATRRREREQGRMTLQ